MMEWDRLISDYLDDLLSPEETAALVQWIHSHPDHARKFASAAFMHRRLEQRLPAIRLVQEAATLANANLTGSPAPGAPSHAPIVQPVPTPSAHARPHAAKLFLTWRRLGAIAAGVLLILGVLSFLAWPRVGDPAHFVAAEHAQWEPGAAPPGGTGRLLNRALVLKSGLVKLAFDNGNQLIIEGPTRFTVTAPDALSLDQGALTAIVTSAGRGFRVSTPTAQVIDLGTEFGVRATASATRVSVFNGVVRVAGSGGGGAPQELNAGNAVEVSTAGILPIPYVPADFTRVMPSSPSALDLVDLLAGGDGTGSAAGVGIDAVTGRTRETRAVATRLGNRRFVRVTDQPVIDGCFIPGGQILVDSAGHRFTFPTTTLVSYGLIWTGPNIPWLGELPIATTLPNDPGHATTRVLVMHSNNGITFNLDAIRALHAPATLTAFRARVGNSYRPAKPDALPTRSLASIHVIVDGLARFEKRAFVNTDPPIEVNCSLSDNDHFLTLATTDGGDGSSCDWVLWTYPQLVVQPGGGQ